MSAPRISVVMPILAPTPFLRNLAEFAIKTLRCTANQPFELIVVEAVGDYFKSPDAPGCVADKYIRFEQKIGGVREINAGIDAASGEFVLCTGTDIITPFDWDLELLNMFDRKDCGAASLSAYEPNFTIGPMTPMDLVVEGMFSPFTMFRRGWRYDEAFERVYQDSDLIMRMYTAGYRAFRSCRKHIWHLGSVTNGQAGAEHAADHARALAQDERLFYQRWGKSPLAMFGVIRGGGFHYGREHEPLTRQINLHHDPNKAEG